MKKIRCPKCQSPNYYSNGKIKKCVYCQNEWLDDLDAIEELAIQEAIKRLVNLLN